MIKISQLWNQYIYNNFIKIDFRNKEQYSFSSQSQPW